MIERDDTMSERDDTMREMIQRVREMIQTIYIIGPGSPGHVDLAKLWLLAEKNYL